MLIHSFLNKSAVETCNAIYIYIYTQQHNYVTIHMEKYVFLVE